MPEYVFILGRGRSGTTWLGRVLAAHRRCCYKFEPFNAYKGNGYRDWLDALTDANAGEAGPALDALVAGCLHDVDYPPFAKKTCRTQSPLLLRATWQLGKIAPALRGLYEAYGRPRYGDGDSALIKQVNYPNEKLDALAAAVRPKVLGCLRGPYGSVASALQFYAKRDRPVVTDETIARVAELIDASPDAGWTRFRDGLADLSPAGFEALRWRVQTEPLATFCDRYESGMNVRYEDAAMDPLPAYQGMYAFLDWPFEGHVRELVETMAAGPKQGEAKARSEFTVFRDPAESLNKWRKNLSQEQQADVAAVVQDSPLIGMWPEQVPEAV